jgi:hypothetical protein
VWAAFSRTLKTSPRFGIGISYFSFGVFWVSGVFVMELQLLRMFQKQLLAQCEFMIYAAVDLERSLSNREVRHAFYSIQNLINANANVSKALWGQRGKLSNERKPLRDSIGVADDSALRQVDVRNHFEHFDERLDRWWQESPTHSDVDFNIMSKQRLSVPSLVQVDWFRNYDPATGDLSFWGDDFNLKELMKEVQRILPKLREEANKLDWMKVPKAQAEAAKNTDPNAATES